jgi:hypothetical protein
MPQAGYGPVKRMLFDSVLTIPLNINQLRNITGGRDAGQIRYNVTDSGLYVFSGFQWIKANLDSTNISNRINGKLNISDTAAMLLPYMKFIDTVSLSNRINLRVKYSDTAQMLSVYLRKLDTASLSDRINKKQDSITLTTNFKSGPSTLVGATLNIPKYSDTLQDNYVPYVGAIKDVDLGAYQLNANGIKADYLLQVKNTPFSITPTSDYTSITPDKTGFVFYTSWLQSQSTYTQSNRFNYANQAQQNNTREYNLPVRNGTLALVEDTVNLSNRINLKADKATVLTINGVGYDLSANRTWTIPTFDSTSISNRINLKLNISDTASMLSPYLRKADTSSLSNRIDLRVKYSDTAAMLSPYLKSAVTSVGLSMPAAFNVTNSPVTSTGTLTVTGAGTAAQYIRGDGQLATLPSGVSGGSSVAYYLNGSVNQGTIGGSVYYEMNKTPVIGAGTDFSLAGNGLISQFITDVADPNRLEIPAGNWNFEIYMSASSSGGTPKFYVELLKYDGTNFTSIASSSANPEAITNGTTIDLYLTALAIPQTTLLATDRLVIRVYIVNSTGGRTITMHTENSHLCEIITNFAGGVSALNGLTANTQYLAVGTSGNDFAINSLTDTHTFNLPTASSTKRGALSSADWSTFNGKMNYSDTASLSNRINLKLNSSDTVSLSNRINTKLNSADTASLSNRINAKADALSGTTNTVAKFISGTTIGNSNIKDDGSVVSVSTTAGSFGALQVGSYNGNILMNTTNTNGGLIFQNTSSSNKLWDFSSDNNDLVFNESNVNPVMKLKAGGNVVISNLSGTGTRMVVADANGVLSSQAISGVDTTSLSNRINLKLNISDTASMLSGYQSAINSKQAAITLTTTGTSGAATFSSNTLNIPQYQAAGTYVTSVTGTSPIVSSGGTTPAISIPAATSSVNGYLSSTDWTTFNNKSNTSGTVTSVATGLGLSGGTITTSGTLLVDTASASILSRQRAANTYATTSALSGYLPLTGGTLTGALGGTSATFSSSLEAGKSGSLTVGDLFVDNPNKTLYVGRQSATGGDNTIFIVRNRLNTPYFYINPSNDFAYFNNSNVGIGTTTDAGYKLDVNGTGRFSGNLTTTNSIATAYSASNLSAVVGQYVNNLTAGGFANLVFNAVDAGGSSNATSAISGISETSGSRNSALTFATREQSTGNIVERMRITSGGNVGIGTTTDAGYKLDVNGTGRFANVVDIQGTRTPQLTLLKLSTNTLSSDINDEVSIDFGRGLMGKYSGRISGYLSNFTTYDGGLKFYSSTSGTLNASPSLTIASTGAATFSSSVTAKNALISWSAASAANLLMNDLSGNSKYEIGWEASSNNFYIYSYGGGVSALKIAPAGAVTLSSLGTGTVTASSGVLSTVSDSSYKIADGFIENALPSVMNLKPRYFYWKDKSGLDTTIRQLGFYAQEVNSAIGEEAANTPKENSPWGINDRSLIAYLTKAIQELSVKNEALIKRIETLENK